MHSTALKNISAYKHQEMQADWQQGIVRHLTGVTPGLLTRDQTKLLMGLVDGANLTPLQYYLENFRNRGGLYHFCVAGRELGRAHACS